MLEHLVEHAGWYIHTNPWLALVAVFVGGMLTASNPCVLAMIPLMISLVAGRREEERGALRAFLFSLVFVAGLGITFVILGMAAAFAGKMYGEASVAWNWVAAVVCLVMGLHLMELITVPIPSLGDRFQPRTRGFAGAFLLGLLFGVVSAPCAAPILVVLLTYLAASTSSVSWGAALLMIYALGHSVLILAAGTSMGVVRQLLENNRTTRALGYLRCAAR